MEQKQPFVSLAATGRFTFTELCADYHVSRNTGHKWVVRYRQDGAAGSRERIRRPPASSTIAVILHRAGLSQRPRRKPGLYEVAHSAFTVPPDPNHVWTVDFKGWFLLGNGQRCDPLTVCDLSSRYHLACRARPDQRSKKQGQVT